MDARLQESRDLPLAVDLDGTLIATDLLWETIFLALKSNPLIVFLLPIWALAGKARLKLELARRVTLDASRLPYRQDFLDYLRSERASGRTIVLATAAAEPLAHAVAAHLGIFSKVFATSEGINLASRAKAAALVEAYGKYGFDYAGNDRADLAIFDQARNAIVVAPDRAASGYQRAHDTLRFDAPRQNFKTYVKMLRVHQWLKNLLVFAPVVLAHDFLIAETMFSATLAFIAFSASASAIYIINDIIDLPLDRVHPRKKHRPFASGAVSIPFGLSCSAALLAIAAAICFFLPPMFAVIIAIYIVSTTAYSLAIKRMLLLDVICLAGLYALRLLGGKLAANIPMSFWLMAFALFFFLSLAFLKRYVELQNSGAPEQSRIAGRGYRPEDIGIVGQSGVSSGFTAVLVLALYINSDAVGTLYSEPWLIWPLVPIVLYINMRVWVLAHRREMNDDPVVFIASDWRSQIFIALGAALLVAAGMV